SGRLLLLFAKKRHSPARRSTGAVLAVVILPSALALSRCDFWPSTSGLPTQMGKRKTLSTKRSARRGNGHDKHVAMHALLRCLAHTFLYARTTDAPKHARQSRCGGTPC